MPTATSLVGGGINQDVVNLVWYVSHNMILDC